MGKNSKLGLFLKIDIEMYVKKYQLFRKISSIFLILKFVFNLLAIDLLKKQKFRISCETILLTLSGIKGKSGNCLHVCFLKNSGEFSW